MPAEVAVIGAGLGGLSAAIALAARGARVRVLEAGPEAGGKAGAACVDGVRFDTGPSLLTMPDVLDRVLERAGVRTEDVVALRRLNPAFRYRFADGQTLDIAETPEETLENVRGALGPEAAAELRAFLGYARGIWEASAPPFVYGPAPQPATLLRTDVRTLFDLRRIDALRTMSAAIDKRVTSPHLRAMLSRFATYNGSDPRRAPATLHCIAWVELGLGGFGVEGGIYRLVEALMDTALRLGVTLHFDTPARALGVTGGRVREVVTDEGAFPVDAVVANADAAHVLEELLPEAKRRKLHGEPSTSGWNAVIRAQRRPRAGHTVWFDAPYEEEFVDLFDRERVPQTPTIYTCAQEPAHGVDGWAKHEPLFVMVNAPPTSATGEQPEGVEGLRARVLERLLTLGAIAPDDEVVWERTPRHLAQRFPGSRGSIYGLSSNSRWSAFLRPANRSRKVQGLYFASGSAHPGGGMPLCMLSGLAAADALAADHALAEGVAA